MLITAFRVLPKLFVSTVAVLFPSAAFAFTCASNQAVDPTCSALVAGAFCQAKVPDEYGNAEIYGVSRENPECDGVSTGCLSASETRAQTCAIACEKFHVKFFPRDSSELWGPAVSAAGRPIGIADLGSLFVPIGRASDQPVRAVGGRPSSGYLEGGGSAYADWCCCFRGFNPRAVVLPMSSDLPDVPASPRATK